MDKKEMMKNAQTTLGSIFTKSRLKKVGIGILICGLLAGGGTWYQHQQKQAEHAQQLQARTMMLEAQAAQNNVALLPADSIRSLTAEAIGIDETAITFREISLKDNTISNEKEKEKKDHADKKHSDKKDTKKALQKHPSSQDYESLAAEQASAAASAFQPVYKVSCRANNVKYSLRIDAVTGDVLYRSVQ